MEKIYKVPYKQESSVKDWKDKNTKLKPAEKRKISNGMSEDEIFDGTKIMPSRKLRSRISKTSAKKIKIHENIVENKKIVTNVNCGPMNKKNNESKGEDKDEKKRSTEKKFLEDFAIHENANTKKVLSNKLLIEQLNSNPEIKNFYNVDNKLSNIHNKLSNVDNKMEDDICSLLDEAITDICQKDKVLPFNGKSEIDILDQSIPTNIETNSSTCGQFNGDNLIIEDLKENGITESTHIKSQPPNKQIQELKIIKIAHERNNIVNGKQMKCNIENSVDETKLAKTEMTLRDPNITSIKYIDMHFSDSKVQSENNTYEENKNSNIQKKAKKESSIIEECLNKQENINHVNIVKDEELNVVHIGNNTGDISVQTNVKTDSLSGDIDNVRYSDILLTQEKEYAYENSKITADVTSSPNMLSDDKHFSDNKLNGTIILNSYDPTKNISKQGLGNIIEKDATSDKFKKQDLKTTCVNKTKPIFKRKSKSSNKILTIPHMSALDFEKECKINNTNQSSSYKKKSEIENLSSFSNIEALRNFEDMDFKTLISTPELKSSPNQSLFTMKNIEDCKILNDPDKTHNEDTSNTILSIQIPITCIPENDTLPDSQMFHENKLNLDYSWEKQGSNRKNESENNLDKTEREAHCQSSKEEMNILTHRLNSEIFKKTENKITSSIFVDEDFIAENIIFREKDPDDDGVIPTGKFTQLNEIFEFNNETTSIEVKDSIHNHPSTSQHKTEQESNRKNREEENRRVCKLSSRTEKMGIGEAIFLVTATDCIKSVKEQDTDMKQKNSKLHDALKKNENCIKDKVTEHIIEDTQKNNEIAKSKPSTSRKNVSENETIQSISEEISKSQTSLNEETDFSDIENCMEMDDDFALTASQLSMLDADERMQSYFANSKRTTGQQTDICGYTYYGNDTITFEIINQLQYLRESVEYIKERLDKSEVKEKTM